MPVAVSTSELPPLQPLLTSVTGLTPATVPVCALAVAAATSARIPDIPGAGEQAIARMALAPATEPVIARDLQRARVVMVGCLLPGIGGETRRNYP